MGGIPSESLQTSATSGNKVSTSVGPVSFGAVSFGGQAASASGAASAGGGGGSSMMWILAGAVALVAVLFLRK